MCYNFALDRLEYSAHSHESPRTLYSDKSFVYDPSCSQTLRRKVYVRKSFCIVRLHTLSFSVSRKSLICHSYENNRGVYQLFPFWNSTLTAGTFYSTGVSTSRRSDLRTFIRSFRCPPIPLPHYL
jgi:hypothetical protein